MEKAGRSEVSITASKSHDSMRVLFFMFSSFLRNFVRVGPWDTA